MFSPCLSAGGIRFLILPVPAGELCFPCGQPTAAFGGPHRGFHVSHEGDTVGVDALSTPGPMVFATECKRILCIWGVRAQFHVAQYHRFSQISMTADHDAFKSSLSFIRPTFA